MATIDTTDILTTAEAATRLGEKASDMLAHVKKYPHLSPPRCGRMFLWSKETVERIRGHMDYLNTGHCIHCAKPWDRPDAGDEEVAEDA